MPGRRRIRRDVTITMLSYIFYHRPKRPSNAREFGGPVVDRRGPTLPTACVSTGETPAIRQSALMHLSYESIAPTLRWQASPFGSGV